jgi:hypothetical protein
MFNVLTVFIRSHTSSASLSHYYILDTRFSNLGRENDRVSLTNYLSSEINERTAR